MFDHDFKYKLWRIGYKIFNLKCHAINESTVNVYHLSKSGKRYIVPFPNHPNCCNVHVFLDGKRLRNGPDYVVFQNPAGCAIELFKRPDPDREMRIECWFHKEYSDV